MCGRPTGAGATRIGLAVSWQRIGRGECSWRRGVRHRGRGVSRRWRAWTLSRASFISVTTSSIPDDLGSRSARRAAANRAHSLSAPGLAGKLPHTRHGRIPRGLGVVVWGVAVVLGERRAPPRLLPVGVKLDFQYG